MVVTYNQVIKAFEDFATSHLQLNTFFSGKEWNFQTLTNVYPALIVLPVPSVITTGKVDLSFNVFVTDILNDDKSNLDEIYSDTLSILTDFISYFKENDDYLFYLVEDSVTTEPFEEVLDDILAGWVANITITIPHSGSSCGLPIN